MRHPVEAHGNTLSMQFEEVRVEVTPPAEAHLLGLAIV
jgi:hypothetical protein